MRAAGLWLVHCVEWLLLGVGLGTLAMVGYETLDARRFQAEQASAFARDAAVRVTAAPSRVAPGGVIGMLDVPRLRLSTPVVEGDDDRTLKRSVGHLPDTPLPWQAGNSAVAGHRDGLFRPLKDVKIGDEIRFRSASGEQRYTVTSTSIVPPDDLSVLAAADRPTLTLITCYPFYFVGPAPQRFVVTAERVTGPMAGSNAQ